MKVLLQKARCNINISDNSRKGERVHDAQMDWYLTTSPANSGQIEVTQKNKMLTSAANSGRIEVTQNDAQMDWCLTPSPANSGHIEVTEKPRRLMLTMSQCPRAVSSEQLCGQSCSLQSTPAQPGLHTHLLSTHSRRPLHSFGHVLTWYVALKPFFCRPATRETVEVCKK